LLLFSIDAFHVFLSPLPAFSMLCFADYLLPAITLAFIFIATATLIDCHLRCLFSYYWLRLRFTISRLYFDCRFRRFSHIIFLSPFIFDDWCFSLRADIGAAFFHIEIIFSLLFFFWLFDWELLSLMLSLRTIIIDVSLIAFAAFLVPCYCLITNYFSFIFFWYYYFTLWYFRWYCHFIISIFAITAAAIFITPDIFHYAIRCCYIYAMLAFSLRLLSFFMPLSCFAYVFFISFLHYRLLPFSFHAWFFLIAAAFADCRTYSSLSLRYYCRRFAAAFVIADISLRRFSLADFLRWCRFISLLIIIYFCWCWYFRGHFAFAAEFITITPFSSSAFLSSLSAFHERHDACCCCWCFRRYFISAADIATLPCHDAAYSFRCYSWFRHWFFDAAFFAFGYFDWCFILLPFSPRRFRYIIAFACRWYFSAMPCRRHASDAFIAMRYCAAAAAAISFHADKNVLTAAFCCHWWLIVSIFFSWDDFHWLLIRH